MGCVLLQEVDGALVPCGYYSRSTTAPERKWAHPNKLEVRAIVWAVDHLAQFLRSRPFTIRTDARNLLWLFNDRDGGRGMHARWIMKLAEFDFTLVHASVPAADALSRAPSFHTAGSESSSSSASVAEVLVVDPFGHGLSPYCCLGNYVYPLAGIFA